VIKIGSALLDATDQLERERGIPRAVVLDSLCDAMMAAYKKYSKLHDTTGIYSKINENSGELGIFSEKIVVETITNEQTEISIEEAQKFDAKAKIGSIITEEITPQDFGRIAAQAAKQVITQRIREAERRLILEEFVSKKGTMTTGIIQRMEGRNVIVSIGRTEAVLPGKEQIQGEYYRIGNRVRVYVLDVAETSRLPRVIISQVHPMIVQELFELEVPEIEDGIVEIKSIAREAGYRTKISVASNDPDVDPVGACIGPRGSRIQAIVNELKNEKIDIIRWSPDPVEFITNALSPAKIISVEVLNEEQETPQALVVVPDDQLSLAIGREGQNVRLAVKLTSWKLDIKSLSQIESDESYVLEEEYYEEE
jgi:N utilization substance protein A